jgi:dTDP-3-amino-3,4,6-trideoxy-alpha-D-glucose transaminase
LPVVPAQPIPLADTKAQYEPLLPELRRAIDEVLESSRFVLGPNVAAFEREAAAYLGVRETVGVANGTDAIVIALDALGVGPGDEVICPAFTFYATAEAIARTGATPVFAEIDAQTHVLDPEDVAARVNPRTKAILPVHLFGRPAPLADLAELDIPIVEDAAQAFGSPEIAGVGIATTFSFYPSKNLFALGDGGMIACRDAELAERIRLLRFHGSRSKEIFEYVGYNSRLDELQAAVLRIFLRHLDGWTRLRRDAAERYRELGIGDLVDAPPDEAGHVYHLFVCRSPDRDRIARALAEEGIGHKLWYDPPLHLQPALSSLGYEPGSLPVTERLARENIALPLWPGITAEQQERVVAVVRQAARVQATT